MKNMNEIMRIIISKWVEWNEWNIGEWREKEQKV
jgi:hypothetical protein